MRRKRGCGCLLRPMIWILLITILVLGVRLIGERLFPTHYKAEIQAAAMENAVSPALLYAVIKAESNFAADSISPKGAKGLMQLMDNTAAECAQKGGLGLTDIFSPSENIRLGAYYLGTLLTRYDGDEKKAVAAYNAGQGRVDGWLRDKRCSPDGKVLAEIPFPETEHYVNRVLFYKKIYEKRL